MSVSETIRAMLDERGIEHDDNDANMEVTGVRITKWDNGGKREVRYEEWRNGTTRLDAGNVSPEQAIAATLGAEKRDTMELWPEWEEVLFANVSDEVAQDNLNEFVHELLDKAATVSEEHETHICKRCGVAYELSIIDKGFGKPRFCPNCGARRSTND